MLNAITSAKGVMFSSRLVSLLAGLRVNSSQSIFTKFDGKVAAFERTLI